MLIKHRLRWHIVIQVGSSARVLHHVSRWLGTLMVELLCLVAHLTTVLCTTWSLNNDSIVVLCVLLLLSVLDLFALGCNTQKLLIAAVLD